MDSKPTRLNEDLVQLQSQPQSHSQLLSQSKSHPQPHTQQSQPTQQEFASVNQPRSATGAPVVIPSGLVRRPSVTNYAPGELTNRGIPPPPIQRIDSRSGITPNQQSLQQQHHQPLPQQQQHQQSPQQPQNQQGLQHPIQQGPLQQPRLIQQPPSQQQQHLPGQYQQRPLGAPTLGQQPRIDNQNKPIFNRGPAPPQLLQQQQIPVNRLPPPQLSAQQPTPQRPQQPLQRAPGPLQNQPPPHTNSGQALSQGQHAYQPLIQNRPQNPIQGVPSDGHPNIRLNTGQYRPAPPQFQTQANTIQQKTVNQSYNPPPIQKLQSQPGERLRMAAEINQANAEKHQPSYIISNSDDVDDVIVRPISQTGPLKNDFDVQPKAQPTHVNQPRVDAEPKPAPPKPSQINEVSAPPRAGQPEAAARSHLPKPTTQDAKENHSVKSSVPSQPAPAPKKPTAVDDTSRKQNGTNGKAETKDDEAGLYRGSHSRASSHKSQEDIARSSSRSRFKLTEKPAEPPKKVSMNKIKVGYAPPPNLRQVRSKIGSLENATHKPGGGNVKIETKKLDFNVQPRIEAKNDQYAPKGGDKKIVSTKLQWNAKSKIGSLDNANHKPGGGDKKILTIKTEFRENAKPKVGSKETSNGAAKESSEVAKE